MKTTLKNFKSRMLATGIAVAAFMGVQAQCTTSTTITNQGSGNITFTNQSTYTAGWNAYVTVNFGDGQSAFGTGSNYTGSHSYAANGVYLVSSQLYSFNPVDSTINCTIGEWDSVFVTDIACSVTATSIYAQPLSALTYQFSSIVTSSQGFFNGDWAITDSLGNYIHTQSAFNDDDMTYTFPFSGIYNIGFSASSYDSLTSTYCSDSVYTTIYVLDTMPPAGCNLQVNVSVTPAGGNSVIIAGLSNNAYTYSYIATENDIYYNTDTVFHTFSTPGNHYVCFFAQDSTAATYCYDSICVLYNTNGPAPIQCNASFYIFQDSLNPTIWYGINNSTASSSATYLWNFGDGSSSNLPYPSHTYAVPGNYTICLTVTDSLNSCTSSYCDSSAAFRLTNALIGSLYIAAPTGIKESIASVNEIKLYPNPMGDLSSLSFNSSVTSKGKVEIVSMLGATLISENVAIEKGSNEFKLNTSALANGIYYVNIVSENRILSTVKAVK